MAKKSILSAGIILCLVVCLIPPVFAQGREYLRTRSGTLSAQDAPQVLDKSKSAVEYYIVPDDEIEIFVLGNPELSRTVIVGPDGEISYPPIGRIKAQGMTISKLEQEITEKIAERVKVVSVGDEIEVFVWQNPDLSRTVIVGPEGEISYPLIGRISAAGMAISELEEKITDELSIYVKRPQVSLMMKKYPMEVSVSLKKYAGNKIIVLGEVIYPGIYTYKGSLNIVDAIALAAGCTDEAHIESLIIVRGNLTENPTAKRVNLKTAITRGTSDPEMVLEPNDIIFVPKTFIANVNKFINDMSPLIYGVQGSLNMRREIRRIGGRER